MHLQLDLVCLCIYVSQVYLVAAITVRNGHFEMSIRSRMIKDCASKLMSKEEFTGFLRVKTSDGQCENMSRSWQEESIEPSYDYAKLITTKHRFISPKKVQHKGELLIKWPVAITYWTRFSLYVTWPQEKWDMYIIISNNYALSCIYDKDNKIWIPTSQNMYYVDELPGTECNVTFAANGIRDLKVLFNGKTMVSWSGTESERLDQLERVEISYREQNPIRGLSFLIHGFDLIQ